VSVKDIPVPWKAAFFAERRWNEDLGRLHVPEAASSASCRCADDSGCPKVAEEGNAVGIRHKAYASEAGTRDRRTALGDASFTRSFDLCTSILTMHRSGSFGGGAFEVASRSGKPAQAGGTGTGAFLTDVARLATCHRFPKEEGVARKKRKEVEASVPARIQSSGLVARTS
jgi:hypothetical protein